jgi:hypothetical protein
VSIRNFETYREPAFAGRPERIIIQTPLQGQQVGNQFRVWRTLVYLPKWGVRRLEVIRETRLGKLVTKGIQRIVNDSPWTRDDLVVYTPDGHPPATTRELNVWTLADRDRNGRRLQYRVTRASRAEFKGTIAHRDIDIDYDTLHAFVGTIYTDSVYAGKSIVAQPVVDWLADTRIVGPYLNGPGWLPKSWREINDREKEAARALAESDKPLTFDEPDPTEISEEEDRWR